MNWTKMALLLLSVAVLAAPAPFSTGLAASVGPIDDYAAREAQAGDLEQFTGGWHGVVLTLILIGVVVWLVYEFSDHHEHSHDSPPPQSQSTPRP